MEYHALGIPQVLKKLQASKQGLALKQAEHRLEKYGSNKLPEEKRLTTLVILLTQFKSPLVYILIIAAIISLFLGEYVDMGIILAAVVVNTVVGFFQEYKAEKSLSQLKKLVEHKAKVLRDGREIEISAEKLVPGDIIFLSAGDQVPADARLFEINNFQVNEASLTGESLPITKNLAVLDKGIVLAERKNMVYMGTTVGRGKAKAVVCATGLSTQLGEIAALVKGVEEEKTPLQIRLTVFARWLSIIIAVIVVGILVSGLLTGKSFFEIFLTSVAIAVAAIPEGLIVAVTVILAIGMQKILKRKALMRKLIAAETLGGVTVICADKTGTLTEGKMQVSHIFTGKEDIFLKEKSTADSEAHLLALEIGLLNNNVVINNPDEDLADWEIVGDPMETALLLAAVHAGLDMKELKKANPRIDEIPFDEEKKYMATLHKSKDDKNIIYIKGAPEILFALAKKDGLKKFKDKNNEFTSKGLRVLAVGYKEAGEKTKLEDADIKDITLVGLVALKDPLRPESRETIQLCKQAGIRPVMVTGDHKLTAKAIYEELGFKVKSENILEGQDLDKMSDEELKKAVKKVAIYARVEPKHKLRIIDAWQSRGEVVAMTGDGVNDAPALKTADIGVALGTGTDVAKQTSDMILLDNNFKTIVAAVEQGRVIFANIRKVILYLLADSFTEIIIVVGSLFLGLPLPITAAQILWVNLVEDGLPNFALAFEPGEKEVMSDRPRKRKEPLLDKEMKILIFIIGIVTDLALLGLFYYFWKVNLDLSHIRTIVFAALGLNSLLYIFSCRSLRHSIWQKNPFSNSYLNFSVVIGLIMITLALYLPFFQNVLRTVALGVKEWLIVLGMAFLQVVLIETVKWVFIVRKKVKV